LINIKEFKGQLSKITEYNEESIENLLRSFAENKNISAAHIIHPVRLALTGQTASPGLFEVMDILGKETVLRRLNIFISKAENFF
jgi:glutamyl/glutaminyl-tRNA synthetase